jgi:regulator of sigma E protease
MDVLIMAGQIILALAILVTLHELGHFAAARMFGIKVEKFYLFFDAWGFKLFSFKKGDTEYGIGWLPLGGYVKIAGMIDESMDTEQMNSVPQDWEFRSKPAWQRLIVMIGGVTVNFILGFLIYILITWNYGDQKLPVKAVKNGFHMSALAKKLGFKNGDLVYGVNGKAIQYIDEFSKPEIYLGDNSYYMLKRNGEDMTVTLPDNFIDQFSENNKMLFTPNYICLVDSIVKESNAEKAGLKKGDVIIGLNDSSTDYFNEFSERIKNYANKSTTLKVVRNNDTVVLNSKVTEDGTLGFFTMNPFVNDFDTFNYSFGQSIGVGSSAAMQALKDNVLGLGKLFSGKVDPRKAVQGPIGIATRFGGDWVWSRFWSLTALLSLILAFMNLLPIPALDGGHVVFLIVEMIIRRPLSDKFMQVMQVIGMVILLSLMVFAFGNDIYKIIFK